MDATFTIPPSKKPVSLIGATVEYEKAHEKIAHLQRAAASMMLGALDEQFPLSDERMVVRKKILDSLAWLTSEVEKWAWSQVTENSKTPSPDSTDLPTS